MIRRLVGVALLLACAGTASAAGPTVSSATGTVTVVRDGKSRPANPGEVIAKEDFLRVGDLSSVTIALDGGKTVEVKGKALVPGRRLHDAKLASGISQLAVALQTIAGKQDGGTAPASTSDLAAGSRMASAPAPKEESAKKSTSSVFGESDSGAKTSAAKDAKRNRDARTNEKNTAEVAAEGPASPPPPPPPPAAEPADPLAEARALARADDFAGASAKLDAVVGDSGTPPGLLAEALVLRARLALQTGGDEAAARKDLKHALAIAPGTEAAYEAAFLEGALLLADGRRREAKRQFATIPADHALRKQSTSLLGTGR